MCCSQSSTEVCGGESTLAWGGVAEGGLAGRSSGQTRCVCHMLWGKSWMGQAGMPGEEGHTGAEGPGMGCPAATAVAGGASVMWHEGLGSGVLASGPDSFANELCERGRVTSVSEPAFLSSVKWG